jgi:hypothetical protein
MATPKRNLGPWNHRQIPPARSSHSSFLSSRPKRIRSTVAQPFLAVRSLLFAARPLVLDLYWPESSPL